MMGALVGLVALSLALGTALAVLILFVAFVTVTVLLCISKAFPNSWAAEKIRELVDWIEGRNYE